MKIRGLLVAIVLMWMIIPKFSFAQSISNEGNDFWLTFPTHDPTANQLANITVFITSKSASEVTVSCGTYTNTQSVPANTTIGFDVPRTDAYVDGSTESNRVLQNKGIHIRVTAGMPNVAAYAHIYAGARSAASLILPFETLGQKYYSMNYNQDHGGKSYLTVVAVENNTDVIIHAKNGSTVPVHFNNAGDVYEYLSAAGEDLTGIYVESNPATSSCKRFAAFSGSTSLTIGCADSRDPMYQQLYPTTSWGKNYGVVPFYNRQYILRILAQEDNTVVAYNGLTRTLNKGQFIDSDVLTTGTYIIADKLICVAQYSLTQACSSAIGTSTVGDPEMILLNPIEFSIKDITVFSSDKQNISEKYINVLIKVDNEASFKVNGVAPTTPWVVLPTNSAYAYNQIRVYDNSLTLTADDGFNAIAYGFGGFESYGYSAGTNLALNQYLTLVNNISNFELSSGCLNEDFHFNVHFPFLASEIKWTFDDGSPDFIDTNPVATSKVVNNETIYSYLCPINKKYTTTGNHQLTVTAKIPTSTCIVGGMATNTFSFKIYDLPQAKFNAALETCAGTSVAFSDQSISNASGSVVNKWFWDFGDPNATVSNPNISTEKNPTHIYTISGVYTAKLYVQTETGCFSNVFEKSITIFPLPIAQFTANSNSCINTEVLISDQSTISSGNIVKWKWDFGDGSPIVEKSDNSPFTYTYLTKGVKHVKLIAVSDKDCESASFAKDINVSSLPIVDFETPKICLNDALAVFVNKSVSYDAPENQLTYLWDFGDSNATSGNPNTSTEKDGRHKYTNTGTYQITLEVLTPNGCKQTQTKTLTVNGIVPRANFEVMNANKLCSNKEVIFKNISTADFGNITKLEWYFDFLNNPTSVEVDDNPQPNKLYTHNYLAFGSPQTNTITVKLIAYTGGVCKQEFIQEIRLLAVPSVVFNDLPAVCINDGNVQLTQGSELDNKPGIGIYQGDGVSETGLFDPKIAGVGTHLITYTYTSNGCSDTKTKTIEVKQSPMANAGIDVVILAGGIKRLEASASGQNLTYKWSPSVGLNRDDILTPDVSPETDTEYTLLVTSQDGCSATDKVFVKVLQNLNVPNSFTPNGDGINDVWNIQYLDSYPNATVEIFTRSGERIFFSNGYKIPFDGNYKNQSLPVGAYYYIISPKNGRKAITGSLTLLR